MAFSYSQMLVATDDIILSSKPPGSQRVTTKMYLRKLHCCIFELFNPNWRSEELLIPKPATSEDSSRGPGTDLGQATGLHQAKQTQSSFRAIQDKDCGEPASSRKQSDQNEILNALMEIWTFGEIWSKTSVENNSRETT